ncbi:MAG TPA: hypothetical protein VF337_01705 [Candidatus Limnocylindrales bacterium]
MTMKEQRSVTTDAPVNETGAPTSRTVTSSRLDYRPSNNETTRRIVVLIFGLVQITIGLRIILLLLSAHEGNILVAIVNGLGFLLTAPFQGILSISSVATGGSVLDVAAVVALAGWSLIELIVIWGLAVFRREPAAA